MKTKWIEWSDNWWVERNEAFFLIEKGGVLFRVDMNSQECNFISQIPGYDLDHSFSNIYCLKYEDVIWAIPAKEHAIWYYSLGEKTWGMIPIHFDHRLAVWMDSYEKNGSELWLIDCGGNKFFKISLSEKKLEKEYVCSYQGLAFTARHIVFDHKLYCVVENKIYGFDCITEKEMLYEIPGLSEDLFLISHDGNNFWLSTRSDNNNIFVWNPKRNAIKEIEVSFSESRSVYLENRWTIYDSPRYMYSIVLGQYVWYIPMQCNTPIVYISGEGYDVHIFDIGEELDTDETLKKRRYAFKYSLLYVCEERYIGLYSFKNSDIFEIDTYTMSVNRKKYVFSDQTLLLLAKQYMSEHGYLREGNKKDERIFSILLELG